MSPSPPPSPAPATPRPPSSEILNEILHHLLPSLLLSSLSPKSLPAKWRLVHSKLSILLSSLSSISSQSPQPHLLSHLLPNLLSTLLSIQSLSHQSPPAAKLRLQSDLHLASSSLSLHLHHLHLLLSLPSPSSSSSIPHLQLFLRDLFTRLQICPIHLQINSLHSLLQFIRSDPPKLAPLVAQHPNLSFLIRLLHPSSHSLIRHPAAAAVSLLATASVSSRAIVFDEGALGPLLRIITDSSAAISLRENAIAAVEAIASDTASAWAVAAYDGVSILVDACRNRTGSPVIQSLAISSLNYISAVDDIRISMVEEGAVPLLINLIQSEFQSVSKNAALCLCSLASFGGELVRVFIIEEGGLRNLIQLLLDSSSLSSDHTLRAIHALSFSSAAAKTLSSSPVFLTRLTDLIRHGNAAIQLSATAVLSNLSPSDELKRSMAPSMVSLVHMLECSKPECAQELASRALVSLLSVRSNRKELASDDKIVARLVQMLGPGREEVCKKFTVSVILSLTSGGGSGCHRRLGDAGACSLLQKLADADVAGARKAMLRISGGRFRNILSFVRRD